MGILNKKTMALIFYSSFITMANADINEFIRNSLNTAVLNEQTGYFKSQTSGLATLGSSRIRWGGGDSITPFHIQTPSFNIGCSGIDMIFGGFSYLGLDYIVEKLKKIQTAAPAFAFKIALSTLCKDCDTIMTALEDISNAINSINFNTCTALNNWSGKVGEKLAGSLSTGIGGGVSESWISSFGEDVSSSVNSFTDWINGKGGSSSDGASPSDILFAQGSLLKYMLESNKHALTPLKESMDPEEYEHLLRALVGDIVGYSDGKTADTGQDNVATEVKIIDPSIAPDRFIDFLFGVKDSGAKDSEDISIQVPVWEISKDGKYFSVPKNKDSIEITFKPFFFTVRERLIKIVESIAHNQPISPDDIKFIETMTMPVASLLNYAASEQRVNPDPYIEMAILKYFEVVINAIADEIEKNLILPLGQQSLQKNLEGKDTGKISESIKSVREKFLQRLGEKSEKLSKEFDDVKKMQKLLDQTAQSMNNL